MAYWRITALIFAILGSIAWLLFGYLIIEIHQHFQNFGAGPARQPKFRWEDTFPILGLVFGVLPSVMIGLSVRGRTTTQPHSTVWVMLVWCVLVGYFLYAAWFPFERMRPSVYLGQAALFLFPVGFGAWMMLGRLQQK